MITIKLNASDVNSKITSVFTNNSDGISHHWNIKIDSKLHSFYLEFLELENFQSILDIENRVFIISDPDILQLQSCFINDSGIKIANEISIVFDKFQKEEQKIRSQIKIVFNSHIALIETEMVFVGYNFYMLAENAIQIIMDEQKINGLTIKNRGINNILYNYE